MPLRVGLIVEGHGEYQAVRELLGRIWDELTPGDYIDVPRPLRKPQATLLQEQDLKKVVDEAKIMLGPVTPDGPSQLILILIDAETLCPKTLAPQLLRWAREARSDADIACVMPNPMFETWFAAAASSLAGVNGLPAGLTTPPDPEGNRRGKTWLKKQLSRRSRPYSETIDQPRFAARMSLHACRQNAPSFDKLCRELEQRRSTSPPTGSGDETASESNP